MNDILNNEPLIRDKPLPKLILNKL